MLLTKQKLQEYTQPRKIKLPETFKNKIVEKFGSRFTDDEGRECEYSEQDVSEQLRKIIQNYQDGGVETVN